MKHVLGVATVNVLLITILILVLTVLLAVFRLGTQLQDEVKPQIYEKTVRIVVTAMPLPTASPSAGVKTNFYRK